MEIVAIITLLGNLVFVAVVTLAILSRSITIPYFAKGSAYLQHYGLWLAFLVALFSTIGSLYFSDVLLLPPCDLCWYQRALMYPQTIILFIAAMKNDRFVIQYILPLSLLGVFVGLYNYMLQIFPDLAASCGPGLVSCSIVYEYFFGYITIPVMSITGFAYILLFAVMGTTSSYKEVNDHKFK